ncbi:hypothetical protein ACFLXI_04835 [Chloroflexota bacterium]
MYKLFWRLKKIADKFFYDERFAGLIRLAFFFALTGVIVLFGYTIFEDVDTTALEENVLNRFEGNIIFQLLLIGWIRFSRFLVYSFRHTIIPVSVFFGALLASAFYVQDVYELPTFRLALRYIWSSFVGFGYPILTIEDGEKQINKNEVNLIDVIGGPGYVNIRPGNVVLFESLRSPSSVRASAVHFISRFETIREIVSLDDQHGFLEETKARTRDGILVIVRDIHYRYRLRTGRRFGDYERRRAIDPYLYSVQAVKNMAYNRSVTTKGLSDWHTGIQLAVDSAITSYIMSHKFDQLTAPSDEDDDPRAAINNNMMSKEIRTRLRNAGAELLWFDIGHFDVVEKIEDIEIKRTIEEQRIETLSARWDGDAMVIRAAGEARRMSYQDVGRAEGQAALLKNIIQALDEAGFGKESSGQEQHRMRNLRGIVWARVAQILDTLASDDKGNSSTLPPGSKSG